MSRRPRRVQKMLKMDAGEATFVFGGKEEMQFEASCEDHMHLVVLESHAKEERLSSGCSPREVNP